MRRVSPYTPEQRAEAERLVRGTARALTGIAAELGIRYGTLCHWAAADGWRESRPRLGPMNPANGPPARREAVGRIACEPRVARQDPASALGVGRAAALLRALERPARRRPVPGSAGGGPARGP